MIVIEHIDITGDGQYYFSIPPRKEYVLYTVYSLSTQQIYVTGTCSDMAVNSYIICHLNQPMVENVIYGFYTLWIKCLVL